MLLGGTEPAQIEGDTAGRSHFASGGQIQGPWWVDLQWWKEGQSKQANKQTEVLVRKQQLFHVPPLT